MRLGKRIGYGWLYNWYAVDNANDLAPEGWRVPSDAEWTAMTDHIGGLYVAGGKLKSTRNEWYSPNTGATDELGFSALPGGFRNTFGNFNYLGVYGYWWSATEYSSSNAIDRYMYFDYGFVFRNHFNKAVGYSVRCIQNKSSGQSDGDTGTLTDVDGNVYKWVVIGDYRWMAENLRTTKYKNGNTIPEITDNTDWANDTTGTRCAYNNDHYYVYPPLR